MEGDGEILFIGCWNYDFENWNKFFKDQEVFVEFNIVYDVSEIVIMFEEVGVEIMGKIEVEVFVWFKN